MQHFNRILFFSFCVLFAFNNDLLSQPERRFVAEWEPAWGTLIRWPLGIPSDLVVELAKDDSLYVLVASYSQRDQAINTFTSWGVNLSHCRFLFAPTNSHWTRDWGPHYIFNEDGVAGIADPVFDGYPWVPGCNIKINTVAESDSWRSGSKGYEDDDAVNIILADSFNCPLISLPVYLTGGNVMVDGRRTAISTQQMLDENFPGISASDFLQIAEDSLGITNYIIVDNPEVNGIQHIDCYAKFLDERTILVKEVDSWNPEYACCEALADHLGNELNCYGEPYHIIRIYCGVYSGSKVAAYTNSLILNKKVLVPLFGISSDTAALQTYLQAMPGYEVIGFQWGSWYYYDALHCRTMGIFDRYMLRIEHKPLQGEEFFTDIVYITAVFDDRSEAGLNEEELKLHWREEGTPYWNQIPFYATIVADSFFSYIPAPVIGTSYEYYISAADYSGRNETLPRTAPEGFFTFTVSGITTPVHPVSSNLSFTIQPSVFSSQTIISFDHAGSEARLTIWSASGKKIREWNLRNSQTATILWDGTNQQGRIIPGGLYIVSLETETGTEVKKCILSR
ncbi:MAG: agmatine deiminase family protein [Bacteroidales bacterium]